MRHLKKAVSLVLAVMMIVTMFSVNIASFSAADANASKYGDAAPKYGDVDRNGRVGIMDASYIQKSLAKFGGYIDYKAMYEAGQTDAIEYKIADVDKSGRVAIMDASIIQKKLAHFKDIEAKYPWIGELIEGDEPTEPTQPEPTDETQPEPTDETQPEPTDETQPEPTDGDLGEGYYLVGSMNEWKPAEGYKFSLYKEEDNEYKLAGVVLKKYSADGITIADTDYYPTGYGNDYEVTEDGTYNVYLRPDGNGAEDWYESVLYLRKVDDNPTEPTQEQPTAGELGEGYYLAGSMNEWKPAEGYKFSLYKEEDNEYKLAGVVLKKSRPRSPKTARPSQTPHGIRPATAMTMRLPRTVLIMYTSVPMATALRIGTRVPCISEK